MASGDSQRAWFPEMLNELKKFWKPDISWEEVSNFIEKMHSMRKNIRKTRNIKPVRMYCKNCKEYHFFEPPGVSIRSLLFALKKISVVTDIELKDLDKNWKKYRKENNLDLFGKPVTSLEPTNKKVC
jgi:RNase P subunit RPR2